jgi:hypothetical protein
LRSRRARQQRGGKHDQHRLQRHDAIVIHGAGLGKISRQPLTPVTPPATVVTVT